MVPEPSASVTGQVISFNLDRDIGLVSIRPGRAVRVGSDRPIANVIERGDHVMSVGCDHGKDPTALASWVTATNRYKGSPNIEANGAPTEGRSGGGLFSSDGKLVGICFAADYEGNEGLYTALETIHDELDRIGTERHLSWDCCCAAGEQRSRRSISAEPPARFAFVAWNSGRQGDAAFAATKLGRIVLGQDPSLAATDRSQLPPRIA